MTQAEQKKANSRLGLILGSIAVAFFVGVIVKFLLLGR
ncbi:cytochrome oxidase small assembly protein [Parvibium lacunae]|nr:cytochrome oxidase small assembly protein [Parvibium lacunae]